MLRPIGQRQAAAEGVAQQVEHRHRPAGDAGEHAVFQTFGADAAPAHARQLAAVEPFGRRILRFAQSTDGEKRQQIEKIAGFHAAEMPGVIVFADVFALADQDNQFVDIFQAAFAARQFQRRQIFAIGQAARQVAALGVTFQRKSRHPPAVGIVAHAESLPQRPVQRYRTLVALQPRLDHRQRPERPAAETRPALFVPRIRRAAAARYIFGQIGGNRPQKIAPLVTLRQRVVIGAGVLVDMAQQRREQRQAHRREVGADFPQPGKRHAAGRQAAFEQALEQVLLVAVVGIHKGLGRRNPTEKTDGAL